MGRSGFESDDLSIQRFLNQSTIQSPSEPAQERVVSLNGQAATAVEQTNHDVTEIHIFNDTGEILRYGGSTVGASSGGALYPNQSMQFKSPQYGFKIYFYNPNAAAKDLDIVEFY